MVLTGFCGKFQSTLPRGSDEHFENIAVPAEDFNPRSLAGATSYFQYYLESAENFNPRSLAGATAAAPAKCFPSRFQSTLPRGSDSYIYASLRDTGISIHAPSRERPLLEQNGYIKFAFQSTLPRGSDHGASKWRIAVINFNPRSLAGATPAA